MDNSIDVFGVRDFREVFNIHLVDYSRSRGHHLEVVERILAPAQELVALAVAPILNVHVSFQRVWLTEKIGDYRVVDDKLCRRKRIYLPRISSQFHNRFAHRGEVNDAGNSGEVLQHHACRGELNFRGWLGFFVPVAQCRNLLTRDVGTIFSA